MRSPLEAQPPNGIAVSECCRLDVVLRRAAVGMPVLQGQNSPRVAKSPEMGSVRKKHAPNPDLSLIN